MNDTLPSYHDDQPFTQVAEVRALINGVALPYLLYTGPERPADPAARAALLRAYCSEVILAYAVWSARHLPPRMLTPALLRFSELRLWLPSFYYEEEEGLPSEEPQFRDLAERLFRWRDLVLLGPAGSGKTTTLRRLAFDLARRRIEGAADAPLPILVELREYDTGRDGVGMLQAALERAALTGDDGRLFPLAAHRLLAQLLPDLVATHPLALLWDGLDEAPRTALAAISTALEALRRAPPAFHLHLVTCRIDRYPQSSIHGTGLHITIKQAAIEPLDDAAIAMLVRQRLGDAMARSLTELFARPATAAAARNPLLLTIICSVFQTSGAAPASIGRLIEMYVAARLAAIAEAADASAAAETATGLAQLAVAITAARGRGSAVPIEWAYEVLHAAAPVIAPQRLLEQAGRAGLLIVDSERVRFSHALLQEYYAALGLREQVATSAAAPAATAETAALALPPAPVWQRGWEETLLLLASIDGPQQPSWRQITRALRDEPLAAARALAAGPLIAETDIGELIASLALVQIHDARRSLRERIAAGEALGLVGDPRMPQNTVEWRGAALRRNEQFGNDAGYWRAVPGGACRIGGWQPDAPAATIPLEPFWIARFPITVAQYVLFVQHGYGAASERWWTPAGCVWRARGDRTAPDGWETLPAGGANRPVVGVSWYEAMAFCAWLSEQLGDALPVGFAVRLPTEAEWEAAATGGSRQMYPWGDEAPTAERAIFNSAGLATAAPVGACPAGAAACGALDMLGNVEEWCGSWYDPYPAGSAILAEDAPWGGNIQLGPRTIQQLPTRGGWFAQRGEHLSCGARFWRYASAASASVGFRVVLGRRA
jgi:formylglycine-generating enzyme required for sulfatase activity